MLPRPLRHAFVGTTAVFLGVACAAGEPADPGLGDYGEETGGTPAMGQGGGAGSLAKAGSGGNTAGKGGGAGNLGGSTAGGGQAGTNPSGAGGALDAGRGGSATAGTSTSTGGGGGGVASSGGRSTGGSGAGGGAGSGASAGTSPIGGAGGRGGTGARGGAGGSGAGQGGSGSGGSGGAPMGGWTDGYVATMYGDISSGDCQPYGGNFTDHTPISTYTCVLGSGPRKVTLSPFSSGQANNSSYYAALGDLSGLWQANGNAGPCACNGSTTATCGGPSCPAEISSTGACGICIAVKCDPNSTFKDTMGFSHNSACNSTTYVVVQNIDACPHNHTTNVGSSSGWCTDRQAQHIDLSCSGLGDISNLGTQVGMQGWLPVSVQVVDCNVGLGKHSL